ncbi:cytochrome c biogenesis protein [Sorangium sp. So ce1078]|uniref:cytochrome c biogenesis protein n=1 Tax=Sorangium sp. So ce1078 TaxID=3133329 RepID=UPI003F634B6C
MGANDERAPRRVALAASGDAAARSARGASGGSSIAFSVLLAASALAIIGTLHFVAYVVPTEASMGIVQKIFYFHAPAGYAMYLGATACFIGSAGYLARGTQWWDSLAKSGAQVAVAMGLIVLITGPLWAAKAWGVYWTWDPRLTTSLLSVLIYIAYVVLRAFTGDSDAERKFAAALGVLGAANLPIIHYSVKMWGGNHPTVITGKGGGLGHPDMKLALGFGFLSFTLLSLALLWARLRVDLASARLAELEQEALEVGIGED